MKNTKLINYTSLANFTDDQEDIFGKISNQLDDILILDMPWDNMISLSGAAGTGKTYLITHLIKYFSSKCKITVTAPTHKALKVIRDNFSKSNIDDIELKTIHSFLNIKLFTDYTKGTQSFKPDKSKTDLSKADILIIDESSMISNELYEYIEDTIVQERVKAILFVGDYYQLLPIDSTKNKVFDIRHQFKLTKIVRQAQDSYIIKVASQARDILKSKNYTDIKSFFLENKNIGIEFFHNEEDFHNNFYKNKYWENEDKVITSFTNKSVDNHNRILRNRFWQEKGYDVINPLIAGDRLVFQSAYTINDKVIFQNNDEVILSYAKKEHFEPFDIDYWVCKDKNQIQFQVVDPMSYSKYNNGLTKMAQLAKKAKYPVKQEIWKSFFEIKDYFIEVKYPYASTIHKLQGSTYKTVYIDLLHLANSTTINYDELYRLIYVAMTRASQDIKILIPKVEQNRINMIEHNFDVLVESGLIEDLII